MQEVAASDTGKNVKRLDEQEVVMMPEEQEAVERDTEMNGIVLDEQEVGKNKVDAEHPRHQEVFLGRG